MYLSAFICGLEILLVNPLLRRKRIDRERLHAYRLVIKAMGIAAVECVLEPLQIVPFRIVHARMRPTAFMARRRRYHRGERHFHQVLGFKRFDARGVEHLAVIPQAGILQALAQFQHLCDALVEYLLGAKHTAVLLHRTAQFLGQLICRLAITLCVPARQML